MANLLSTFGGLVTLDEATLQSGGGSLSGDQEGEVEDALVDPILPPNIALKPEGDEGEDLGEPQTPPPPDQPCATCGDQGGGSGGGDDVQTPNIDTRPDQPPAGGGDGATSCPDRVTALVGALVDGRTGDAKMHADAMTGTCWLMILGAAWLARGIFTKRGRA